MDVVFVDNHLLVVAKPAGLSTQPSLDTKDSLEEQAKAWLKITFQKPGNVYLHAVHRLDKPVSGLVLFARNSKSLSRLNAAMRAKQFKKKYTAFVEGTLKELEGALEHYLIHGDRKAILAKKDSAEAKFCRLHYRVLRETQKSSLIEIDLETGRYHQIRAQFAAAGHPIIGDVKYGARPSRLGPNIIALHQGEMSFPHPKMQNIITFSCPCNWKDSIL